MSVRDTRFHINEAQLRPLDEFEAATFLGTQVGFNIVPPMSTLAEIISTGLKLVRSKLALWQRLDELKMFFFPSTVHLMRIGFFAKTDWPKWTRSCGQS